MPTRVLVPMDGSEMAEAALEYALDLFPDGDITVFVVVGEPSAMMGGAVSLALEEDIEEAAEELAADILDRARQIAQSHDIEISTAFSWGSPAKEIVSRAEDFDTVVIGSHGGSVSDNLFVGNVAKKVFRRSPVPVTVVR
ncbi:Nucleotide-binding protein, UspA family [Halanaeroarchaeum sp. HSR-CO]|uniref:universal stress protein n=1 Tax=Halanaeroarchaeum sp. HSR-CO TaxID=2866382 RepID=UPI00217E3E3B|nr:universal stress protein [Halanaeroarchaeum sp. HSR-CO]UWG47482.1 Nucleotide-binding protein, UspA family [Halanaeroarchaeum sp. HSR-CO]